MLKNNQYIMLLFSAAAGIALGMLGGGVYILIIWTIIGTVIGYTTQGRRNAVANGAVFGFLLSYVFMVAGYTGKDPVSTKLLPFIIFGLVGAVCGGCLGLFGHVIHSRRSE